MKHSDAAIPGTTLLVVFTINSTTYQEAIKNRGQQKSPPVNQMGFEYYA